MRKSEVLRNEKVTYKTFVLIMSFVLFVTCVIGVASTKQIHAEADSVPVVTKGNYEVAYWEDFAKGCVTYTFDDALNSHFSTVRDMFDKYGYKATFYLITNVMYDAKWQMAAKMAQNGHEMGSHCVTHDYLNDSNADYELGTSKDIIEEKIGKPCLTVAYPYCYMPTQSIVEKYYISGRGCDGDIENGTPYNYMNIGSITCGSQYSSCVDSSSMISMIEKARDNNGWTVFLIHGIENGEYAELGADNLEATLSYISENEDDYKVATFVDATKYSKERDSVQVNEVSSDTNSKIVNVTDSLDDELYDYPLSIRIENTNAWESITVTQNGENVESEIKNGYIYFEAVPDKGEVVIANNVPDTNVKIDINGYQISTIYEGYRTIYSIDDPDGEVDSVGMLYGMEQTAQKENMEIGGEGTYTYEATKAGKYDESLWESEKSSSYVMTMKFAAKTSEYYGSNIYVRAYAKLTNGTYIYSDVYEFTVHNLAKYLYNNQLMPNKQSHDYLYSDILSITDATYTKIEYDLTGSLAGN